MRAIAVCVAGVLGVTVCAGSAHAQTSTDTLRIEIAVAQYLKPSLRGTNTILESRRRFPPLRQAAPPERPAADKLALALGIPAGHLGDVFGCDAHCARPDVDQVIAFDPPTIVGDSASMYVESVRRGTDAGRAYRVLETQEYVLRRTDGKWRVVRLGMHSIS